MINSKTDLKHKNKDLDRRLYFTHLPSSVSSPISNEASRAYSEGADSISQPATFSTQLTTNGEMQGSQFIDM